MYNVPSFSVLPPKFRFHAWLRDLYQPSTNSIVLTEINGRLNYYPGQLYHQSYPGQGAPTLLTAFVSVCNYVMMIMLNFEMISNNIMNFM